MLAARDRRFGRQSVERQLSAESSTQANRRTDSKRLNTKGLTRFREAS
jgi:hypothetical protein